MYGERYKSHHDSYRALKKRFEDDVDKKEYVAGLLNGPATTSRVIYLHVPFCNKVCTFCPFHRPDELRRREYDRYLIEAIDRISGFPYMQSPVDAINFGGGTPTAISPDQMRRVLEHLHRSFDIREGAEISIETSVSELTDEMTQVLKEGGVNRLSVGIQTFDNGGRRLLGRRGSGEAAYERLAKTKAAGFENLGIDLIYNWPGETEKILADDIGKIKSLGLAGISFYSLMLHEGTPIVNRISDEDLTVMKDTSREKIFFDMIMDELAAEGYKPFELTKLIRNGLDRYDYVRIRHSGGSCIGIGHGAGGNLDRYVFHNSVRFPLLDPTVPVSAMGRVLKQDYFILDEFINDLQKMEVNLDRYSRRLGFDLKTLVMDILERAESENLIRVSGPDIILTQRGIFWGNNFIDELIRRIVGTKES